MGSRQPTDQSGNRIKDSKLANLLNRRGSQNNIAPKSGQGAGKKLIQSKAVGFEDQNGYIK